MPARQTKTGTLVSAQTAIGAGKALFARDYHDVVLCIDASDTAVLTVKIQGSIQDTAPAWDTTASATNMWSYINFTDYNDNANYDGDTGVPFAADGQRLIEVNTNGLHWICPNVTAYTSGKVTIKYAAYTL